jgi:hypothetical protein
VDHLHTLSHVRRAKKLLHTHSLSPVFFSNSNCPRTGLVYYKDSRAERPSPTDNLLITVRTSSDGPVLAAARLPLQKIRLPLRFRMTEGNAILPDAWKQALREQDLYVQVDVCSDDGESDTTDKRPGERDPSCRNDSGIRSKGVAKLLRLENNTIRAPVSLPLELG